MGVLEIGDLNFVGIGYWSFGIGGYWVLDFRTSTNTHRLGPTSYEVCHCSQFALKIRVRTITKFILTEFF